MISTLILELIALLYENNNVSNFNSFGVEHVSKKLRKLLIVLGSLLHIIKTLKQIFSEYKHMIQ